MKKVEEEKETVLFLCGDDRGANEEGRMRRRRSRRRERRKYGGEG